MKKNATPSASGSQTMFVHNSKKDNRTKRIDIRFTKSEYETLLAGMEDSPYTTKGAYMRAKLLRGESILPSKNRYLAILAAGQLRDAIKKMAKYFDNYTQVIQSNPNILKACDKQLIVEIKQLILAVKEKLQNAEL